MLGRGLGRKLPWGPTGAPAHSLEGLALQGGLVVGGGGASVWGVGSTLWEGQEGTMPWGSGWGG